MWSARLSSFRGHAKASRAYKLNKMLVPDEFYPHALNVEDLRTLLLFAQMLALVANSALSFQATGLVSSTGRSGVVMQVRQPLELSGSLLG